MRLNDSGGSKKKSNPLGIKPTHKASSKKKSGSSWLTRTAKKVYKAIGGKHGYGSEKAGKKKSSKSSKKGKSIMETTTAKKKAEKELSKGSSKTVKPNTKISHTSTKSKTPSKPKTSTSHKSTSSTHKTTSSAKKDAVKRASGTSSKPKTSTSKKAPSKTTAKKPSTKTASKKTPSKASQIKSGFKKGSDSYYNGQKALLDSGKTTDLAGVSKAYNESMESENKNKRDTQYAYDDRVGVINDDAYRQAQLTQIGAYDMGIQNSQQLLGLQAGDSYRRDTQVQGAMTERDRMLADINGRISTIVKQKGIDTNTINSNYNTNLRGARATADGMYYDKSSEFDSNVYSQDRQHAWDVEDRNANFAHDREMQKMSASYGGGGGGRSSAYGRASSGGSSKGTSGLNQQAKQYKQAKQTTPLGAYNKSFANKNQSVVVKNKYPLGAPPTVASNPNLSAWQKMKMIGG